MSGIELPDIWPPLTAADKATATRWYEGAGPDLTPRIERLAMALDKEVEAQREQKCCASAEMLHDLAGPGIMAAQLALVNLRAVLVNELDFAKALRVSVAFEKVRTALHKAGQKPGQKQRPGYTADAQGNVVQMRSKP